MDNNKPDSKDIFKIRPYENLPELQAARSQLKPLRARVLGYEVIRLEGTQQA